LYLKRYPSPIKVAMDNKMTHGLSNNHNAVAIPVLAAFIWVVGVGISMDSSQSKVLNFDKKPCSTQPSREKI
jgi:hypothetical protein